MTDKSKQRCLRQNSRGFTLIEILIAIAIFSIGILAVAKMQLWNVQNTTTGNITTMATMLAREQIEVLKGKNISDADLNVGANACDTPSAAGGIFTRCWSVAAPVGASSATRLLEVDVSWNRRVQRSVVLTTITRGNGT
jgi:type IV pilus modification protein PilV